MLKNLTPGRFNCVCGSSERMVSSLLFMPHLPPCSPLPYPTLFISLRPMIPLFHIICASLLTEGWENPTMYHSVLSPDVSPLGYQNYQNWKESWRFPGTPPTLPMRKLSGKSFIRVWEGQFGQYCHVRRKTKGARLPSGFQNRAATGRSGRSCRSGRIRRSHHTWQHWRHGAAGEHGEWAPLCPCWG